MLTFLICMLFVIIIGIIILVIVFNNENKKTNELLGANDFEIGYNLKRKEEMPKKHIIDELYDMAQEHLDSVKDHHHMDTDISFTTKSKKDDGIYEDKGG